VQARGLLRICYHAFGKTSFQHPFTGAAVDLIRINAWLSDKPRAAPGPAT
jgi:hypothetical protein